MEPSAMRTLTVANRTRSNANMCINDENRGKASQGNVGFLYSVAISLVRFIQWFLGILFFGPALRVWSPFRRSSLLRNVPHKNPKKSRIFVLESVESCDRILQSYCSQYPCKMNFLGVDCEWVNKKGQANAPVALLQIATPLCDCFLIRLCKMDGRMPQSVKEVLEDRNILKFGVGIQDDVKKLSAMFAVDVWGCVDLRHVTERCRMDDNGSQQRNQKMSLDALAKRILGVTMDKSWRIRCSNWEAEQLSTRQIEYAMNDALVASHIFLRLVKSKAEERKVVTTSCISEDCSSVEKKAVEIHNGESLSCGDDKASKQSQCAADIGKPDSTVNSSDNDLTGCSQIFECFSTEEEPNIALSNENINDFELEGTELEGNIIYLESSNIGNLNDNNMVKSQVESVNIRNLSGNSEGKSWENSHGEDDDDDDDNDDDSRTCSKALQDLGSECYQVTAVLNKLESEAAEGYLSREEVTILLQDPLFLQRASSLCKGVVDFAFKEGKRKVKTRPNGKANEQSWLTKDRKPYKRGTSRKSPLYMNCMLAAPDGSRLCTLDRKKADWYIDKGIGRLTCLDPYTVQLNFEPSGRPGTEDSYYLNFKDNICVVCGSNHSYMRKNIVPHDYRRYFPLVMKDHHSHDILLMCPSCHCLSNRYDDRLRKELADKYDAPLGNATVARLIEDPELRKVKSAAKALSYAGAKLPEDRRQELTLIVQAYFNTPDLTEEMISQAVTMETRKENSNFVSHGQEVVRKVREEGKLLEFEKMWREHFIDSMRPQYLPSLWSVDHRHEGLKGKLEECDDS